jgi:hypothetical protein
MEPVPEETTSEFGDEGPEEEAAAEEDQDETEELGQATPARVEEEEEY